MAKTCAAILSVLIAPMAAAEDWPCFRGPTRQGVSRETNLPVRWSATSNVRWKTAIPGEGWSSPIVFGERVYVTTAVEGGASLRLIALERRSGKILWDREVVRQKLGRKQPNNSYASPTPASDGERVYVFAFDGTIAAVGIDGEAIWVHRDHPYASEHGPGVSPLLHGDLLIVPFDGSSDGEDRRLGWQTPWDKAFILALDAAAGKVRWKGTRGLSRIAHVTPNILIEGERAQLVSAAGDVVQAHDLATGERIWTFRTAGEGVVPSIVLGDGLVFATTGFGEPTLVAVRTGGRGDVTETHLAWKRTQDVPMIPSAVYAKPYLFTITETGALVCAKAETGEVVWRERLGGRYSASPVLAEGRLYILSERGETTIVEAGPAFSIVAQSSIGETCRASMAISGRTLFIRTERNLYAIGEAGEAGHR